ncbi:Transmembrane protein 41-like protein [Aphelenchoides besseyi]|nr:Transmembrane protein 41-like protein [Aphelenchoides besseyi]KAI6211490.1 Transmembrane protein 41-like protein [Aphelenchoides besseyi]
MISTRAVVAATVVVSYASILTAIYANFPEMTPEERIHFKLPRSLDDAKQLGGVLSHYKNQHFYTVLSGVAAIYVVLQSFAIPGSIFLTILAGYLFPFWIALILVCTCSACGAAMCYYLSFTVGRGLVGRYFPEKLKKWQNEVQRQRGDLFNYIVFLRVTPILPNWFINIASPVIGVPILPFFFGTFAGVAPPSCLFIQSGTTLQMMTNTNAVWSWSSMGLLAAFGLLSLIPVIYKKFKIKTD